MSVGFGFASMIGLGYEGREAGAVWRATAEDRIEQHRKATFTVRVQDEQGEAVPGVAVTVRMRRHAFGWGSAVTADLLTADTADARRYREVVERDFNRVVFENDLKWPQWERQGRLARVMAALEWLEAQKIEVRAHCLVWPSWKRTPGDLKEMAQRPGELWNRVAEHILEEMTLLQGRLADCDVVNEPYSNHDVLDVLGADVMAEWFELAHQADPQVKLYVNDFSILSAGGSDQRHQTHYEETIQRLVDLAAPLHGIGLQSHFGKQLTPPERLVEVLDRFARFGLPLQITEHDIDIDDEQLQADYTRDFLTVVFSHPAVVGALSWGFWEGRHWRPRGAYYRQDWSLKPAGQVWRDLVMDRWWTNVRGETDAAGCFAGRGFLGDYEVVVPRGGVEQVTRFSLKKKGEEIRVTVPARAGG